MSQAILKMPISRRVPKDLDIHFRVTKDQYEYVARASYGRHMVDVLEEKQFEPGWQERLAELRKAQRKLGVPDVTFWHPRQRQQADMAALAQGSRRKRR